MTQSKYASFQRNGQTYGVTQGRFRGRWWNYYERGRSYLDGQFWKEAEADFRIALAERDTDGLWARTYGLHFLPEYFPHRELGVALYHQGRLDEAVRELEQSIHDKLSARAANHLARARSELIAARGLDKHPPAINLSLPLLNQPVANMETELRGEATDDTYVAEIRIDGVLCPIDVSAPEIHFTHPVQLVPGANTFTIAARDLAGNRTEQQVTLNADLDGPAVSFDAPVILPGRIKGVALDHAGVASLSVAGKEAALSPVGNDAVAFEIDLNLGSFEGIPLFTCTDKLGNSTNGRLPVDLISFVKTQPSGAVLADWTPPVLIPLAPGLTGLWKNGQLAAVAKTSENNGAGTLPQVKILNLLPGQVYYENEVVVDVEIQSSQPIQTANIDGVAIQQIIPNRTRQICNRRIPLETPGEHTIIASAKDAAGQEASDLVSVQRQESEVDEVGRLDAAFLGYAWEMNSQASSPPQNVEALVEDFLLKEFYQSNRFAGIRERNPEMLKQVLAEQDLSALLGDKKEVLALQQLVPAEVFLVGKVHRYSDTLEIILEGKSTEAFGAEEVLTIARADVEGAASDVEGMRELIHTLAVRFLQELPRVQGYVADVSGENLITTLGRLEQRVRPNLKVVVYRKGPPVMHPVEKDKILRQGKSEILAEALLTNVDDVSSDARIIRRVEALQNEPIENGYFVVTK